MTRTTTLVNPNLKLVKNEHGLLTIDQEGIEIHVYTKGTDHEEHLHEVFIILDFMKCTRREYIDGSVGYSCHAPGYGDFGTSSNTLDGAIQKAAELISVYLDGRDGNPLFIDFTPTRA